MPRSHLAYTGEFLLSARSILVACQDLQEALTERDPTAIELAIAELEHAYTLYDQAGDAYRMFMLGRLGTTRSAIQAERVSTDALASLVTDLQVARVLLAAGEAVGETGPPTREARAVATAVPLLEEALRALDETTRQLRRPLAEPISKPPPPTRGLVRPAREVAIEPVQSSSLEEAKATFSTTASDTLEHLVAGVRRAVMACIEALTELDQQTILRALRMLGVELQEIPDVGRLIRLGVDRVRKAIDALVAWLGDEALEQLKERLEEILRRWLSEDQIEIGLRRVLRVEETRSLIQEALTRDGLTREQFDRISTALKTLEARFEDHVGLLTQAAKAVTVVGGLLTTSLGAQAALLSATAYVGITAWAIGIGVDYVDSGRLLDRVEGVGTIVRRYLETIPA